MRYSRKRAWKRRLAVVLGCMLFVCIAWAAAAGATRGTAKPVLRYGLAAAPDSLDPAHSNGANPFAYETLIKENTDGTYSPGLATSWHFVKAARGSGLTNKVFELTLRHNARFSDGTPVTAQAVKTYLDYSVTGAYAFFIGPVGSVEAIGRWTVRIHLKSPSPTIVLALGSAYPGVGAVASPTCVKTPSMFATQTCGAGPYMLDPSQTVSGDHYTLVPNPYYYDKSKAHWSKVIEKVVPTPASMLQAMQAGQIDVANGDPSTAPAARAAGFSVLHAGSGPTTFSFDVAGTACKPLADVRVRQALNYAVDREAIANALVGKDGGGPGSVIVSLDGNSPKYGDNYYTYNPAKARSLLAAAGYANGFTLDSATVPGFVGSLGGPLVQAVAKYFAAVGVTLKYTVYPVQGDWVNALFNKPTCMEWFSGALLPTWVNYNLFIKPGSPFNRVGGGWNDKTLFNLWVKGSRAANPDVYWQQITARITTQADFLPLVRGFGFLYAVKKIGGVKLSIYGSRPQEWFPT